MGGASWMDTLTGSPPITTLVGYGSDRRWIASVSPASATNCASVPISWLPEILRSVELIIATVPPMTKVAKTSRHAITSTLPRSLPTVSRMCCVFMAFPFLLPTGLREHVGVVQEVDGQLAGARGRARRDDDVREAVQIHVPQLNRDDFAGHVHLDVGDRLVLAADGLNHQQIAGI